jgi:hypothetical protein
MDIAVSASLKRCAQPGWWLVFKLNLTLESAAKKLRVNSVRSNRYVRSTSGKIFPDRIGNGWVKVGKFAVLRAYYFLF